LPGCTLAIRREEAQRVLVVPVTDDVKATTAL
jgi:hypothetical protein